MSASLKINLQFPCYDVHNEGTYCLVRLISVFLKKLLDNNRDIWHKGIKDISVCSHTGNTFGLFLGFVDNKKHLYCHKTLCPMKFNFVLL